MQKVVLATGNAGKVRELASLLSDFGLDIVAQTDLGVDSAEETGLTFIENAILKARHAAKVTALPAIADDSGLAVDVLGGAPGIYSARYSGEDATDQKNLQKLLETMKDPSPPVVITRSARESASFSASSNRFGLSPTTLL